jgi:hypothetical protein
VTKIKIPTVDELEDRLAGLDRLLTAKRWERAAIVWAFTTNDDVGGRPKTLSKKTGFPVPMGTFAGMGFAGLTMHHTVARYRNAWQEAIDQGKAREVHPGDEVELPDLPWPPQTDHHRYNQPDADVLIKQATEDHVGVTKVLDIAENTTAMQTAIKASPKVREAAHAALNEEAAARYANKPGGERLAELAKETGANLHEVVHVRENPQVIRAVIRSDHKLRQAASDAIGESMQEQYSDVKFRPEDPDDFQFGALFEARSSLERAVKAAQDARRKLRDVAMDAANKGVIAGLVHRLSEVTEDLRKFVDDDVFETGIRRVLEEGPEGK